MNILAVILAASLPMATRQAATNIAEHVVAEATPGIVAAAVAAVPAPDYSTGNTQLVATIEATAPAPGNYAAVSNAAMTALHSETDPTVPEWAKAESAPLPPDYVAVSNAAKSAATPQQLAAKQDKLPYPTNAIPQSVISGLSTALDGKMAKTGSDSGNFLEGDGNGGATVSGYNYSSFATPAHDPTEGNIASLMYDGQYEDSGISKDDVVLVNQLAAAATAATNYTDSATNALSASLSSRLSLASLAATNYTDEAIGAAITNTNTVFSNAVLSVGLGIDTNTVAAINALVDGNDALPVGGATVGGLLLALAAAVAALARKIYYTTAAQSASNNAITLSERTFNTFDATEYDDTDTVTVTLPAAPTAASGKVADVLLRLDTGADVPTLVFDENANVFIAADDAWATLEASSHNVFSFTSAGTTGSGNAAKRVWVVGRVTSAIAGGS